MSMDLLLSSEQTPPDAGELFDDPSLAITVEYIDAGLNSASQYLEMSEQERAEADRMNALGASILAIISSESAEDQSLDPSPGSTLDKYGAMRSTAPESVDYDNEAWKKIVDANEEMGRMARVLLYPLVNKVNLPIDPAETTLAGLN